MSSLETMDRSIRDPKPRLGQRVPANAIGVLHSALLPSLGVHGGLSLIAYGIARATDRVEVKDYLWPTGMVLNAWWSAVGRRALQSAHSSVDEALDSLSFYQKVLLGGVTAWCARLAYRIVSRSLRRGKDDARYEDPKQQDDFWNGTAAAVFGLEAVFQSLISLPFTIPFRTDQLDGLWGATQELAAYSRWLAAGIFVAGLSLETLADLQLDAHKEQQQREMGDNPDLYTSGVWSVVRHPNYLGDAMCHLAFPLWCYGSRLFTPWMLLGPVANYVFLRYVGGDRENEASQSERYARENSSKKAQLDSWQREKQSFWPGLKELVNPWTLVIIAAGIAGAVGESWLETAFTRDAVAELKKGAGAGFAAMM